MKKEGETDFSMEKISKYFHLPINDAATELGIGVTTLRYKCRNFGIKRWPNRKLDSLETTINNIQVMSITILLLFFLVTCLIICAPSRKTVRKYIYDECAFLFLMQEQSKQGLMNKEQVNDTIKMFKEKIALINRFPDTPLEKNTKKLRQFCYKNNNRMKKKKTN